MKSLGEALSETRFFSLDHKKHLARIKAALEKHPDIIALKKAYDVSKAGMNKLYAYSRHCDHCRHCRGLEDCQNEFTGHRLMPDPLFEEVTFYLGWCRFQQAQRNEQKIKQRIKSHHVPTVMTESTFEELDVDSQRKAAITESMKYCLEFKKNETVKGLYLYGSMGIGKTKIIGAVAQELAQREIEVAMVYVPDFFEEIKGAISSNTVSAKLDAVREVDVLILDDIGAEPLTTWTRDEVLGPLLHRRMEQKPTLYTSNLTLAELERHLTNVRDFDKMEIGQHRKKAQRIMERIEPWVKCIHVNGRNRRRNP